MTESPNDDRRPVYSQKELQFRHFDERGEQGVRDRIAAGHYQDWLLEWAEEWVSLRDLKAAAAEDALAADKKVRSAERSSAIASRAKTVARMAVKFAVVAAAVSIVTGIASR